METPSDLTIKYEGTFWGYKITPNTTNGKEFARKYKGVLMNSFSVPCSQIDGVVKLAHHVGLTTETTAN